MGWKRERFHFRIQQIAPHFLAAERNALTPDDPKMYNFVVLSQPSKMQVMLLTDDCYWPADRIDSARRQRACQHGGSLTKEKKKRHRSGHHTCCSKQLSIQPLFFFFFFLCTQNTLAQLRRDTKHVLCVKGHAVHISSVSTVCSGEQI